MQQLSGGSMLFAESLGPNFLWSSKDGADWVTDAIAAVRNISHGSFKVASQQPRVALLQESAPPPAPPALNEPSGLGSLARARG